MELLISFNPDTTQKKEILDNYKQLYDDGMKYLDIYKKKNTETSLINAAYNFNKLFHSINQTEYLLVDSKTLVPKKIYVEITYNLGTLIKEFVEIKLASTNVFLINIYNYAIFVFMRLINIEFDHPDSIKQLVSIFSQLSYHTQSTNINKSLEYMKQSLMIAPENALVHYNIAHLNKLMNNYDNAYIHYKISLELNKNNSFGKNINVNNYLGLSFIYASTKNWTKALFYLLQALKIDPTEFEIYNQLGIVYTELRRTDLANDIYHKGIEIAKSKPNNKEILSRIYLNYGHLFFYNGQLQQSHPHTCEGFSA